MRKLLLTTAMAVLVIFGAKSADIINAHFSTGDAWNYASTTIADCESKGDRTVTEETTFTNEGFTYTTLDCGYAPTCGVKKTPATSGVSNGYVEINKTGYLIIPAQSDITTIDMAISATGTSNRGIIIEKSVNGGDWTVVLNQPLTKDDAGIGKTDAQSGYVIPTITINESNVAIRIYPGTYNQVVRIHDLHVQSNGGTPPPPVTTSTFWNVSDFTTEDITEENREYTVNGQTLTIVPGGSVIKIEDRGSNAFDYEDYHFSKRMNMGGSGFESGTSDALPTKRYVSFPVTGDATITVYGSTSSNDAERTFAASNGTVIFDRFTSSEFVNKTSSKGVLHYTGPATTVYMYSLSGGFYIYGILLEEGATGITTVMPASKAVKSVAYYDLLGRPVTASSKGLVIAKTTYTDGTSSSNKMYRLDR